MYGPNGRRTTKSTTKSNRTELICRGPWLHFRRDVAGQAVLGAEPPCLLLAGHSGALVGLRCSGGRVQGFVGLALAVFTFAAFAFGFAFVRLPISRLRALEFAVSDLSALEALACDAEPSRLVPLPPPLLLPLAPLPLPFVKA